MKILTVCLGNICRSPMAEGILRHLAEEAGIPVTTDSAGTNGYHIGEKPDKRAMKNMKGHGIDISDLRARQFKASDPKDFDLILAMDESNMKDMAAMVPGGELPAHVHLIMDRIPDHPVREVPDPYYGGDDGFEQVYTMLVKACNAVIDDIRTGA